MVLCNLKQLRWNFNGTNYLIWSSQNYHVFEYIFVVKKINWPAWSGFCNREWDGLITKSHVSERVRGWGGVNRKGGLITINDFQTGGLISSPFYPIDINVLASNKVFWRRSSFCSLRRVKLQIEDLIDFVVLASKKAFHHISFNWFPSLRSSVFGLETPIKGYNPCCYQRKLFSSYHKLLIICTFPRDNCWHSGSV